MSKIYRMSMSATYFFNVRADSEDDALDWCRTHDFENVKREHLHINGLARLLDLSPQK